jgi:hypothetical protein
MPDVPTIKELVDKLRMPEWRKRSVLVFRGTGVNAWHYYPFLKNFSLAELSEFPAIYGVSGGAAIVWFYTLAQRRLFDDRVSGCFDDVIRSTMNASGWARRVGRVLQRQAPYDAADIDRFLSALPNQDATTQTFAEAPLAANFSVVAHELRGDELRIINARTHPTTRILDVLSRAGSLSPPDAAQLGGDVISDFDFAGASVKRALQQHLDRHHAEHQIYQVNIRRDAVEDRTVFVKVCGDRLPRCSQAMDLLLLFLGLPNSHYRTTFERRYPLATS